ncbi:MAG TPA: hypothetical protein VN541_17215 [Tepidisphaeraceae bacterium]|nr:hypothetical protein [Tepidisphaeraceae bacterium]
MVEHRPGRSLLAARSTVLNAAARVGVGEATASVDPALGQINQSGDPNAIFLKVFSGEVLTAFKLATVADALQRTRSIASGKSAQFPAVG